MINDSVIQAYDRMDRFTKEIKKISEEGLPKGVGKKEKKREDSKKGLLSRSDDMKKYNKTENELSDESRDQQKLVLGYVLKIREAFEEVKNGRTTNIKS